SCMVTLPPFIVVCLYRLPRRVHSFPTRRSSDLILPLLTLWDIASSKTNTRVTASRGRCLRHPPLSPGGVGGWLPLPCRPLPEAASLWLMRSSGVGTKGSIG